MTCIAGAIKDGEVCIGGDGVSIHGDCDARVGTQGKVFRVGEFLIGSSGTVRAQQIMRYVFEPPIVQGELMSYLVKDFVAVLRGLMKDNGCEVTTSSQTTEMDARFLIGIRGRLFELDSGYGVFECRLPFAAVGAADQEALAAMFTASAMDEALTAEEIVRRGLLAAAEFDTGIRPPFTVLTLTRDDWQETEAASHRPDGGFALGTADQWGVR